MSFLLLYAAIARLPTGVVRVDSHKTVGLDLYFRTTHYPPLLFLVGGEYDGENDPQYRELCANGCGTVLGTDVYTPSNVCGRTGAGQNRRKMRRASGVAIVMPTIARTALK